jgi:hypothetical protein
MPSEVNIEGRRILVVSPRFFGYEKRIVEGLEARGAMATHVDDRPSNGTLSKLLIRLNSALLQPKLDAYHRSEIKRLKGEAFDDLLFIVPESCSMATIQRYQKAFQGARTLLYMWDSFENKTRRNIPAFLGLFDRTFSFDPQDSGKHGMTFRPLFFTGAPVAASIKPSRAYAFSFIGTVHSDRYRILMALGEQASNAGLNYHIYPYLPSGLHYWLYKLTKREFWGVPRSKLQFTPLPYAEVLRVLDDSLAVVDIEHPGQRGLTMRTFEVIGAGRKLITTNQNILDYPFYSPERVMVIDRKNPKINLAFLRTMTEPIPERILEKYSLNGWIDDLFGPSVF